jgi:DNA-binding HxlR family transcriptional regulator
VKVPCEHCAGTGRRELHGQEQLTLAAVGTDWTDTGDINRAIPIARSALCNRLVHLVALGLIERRLDPTSARRAQWRRK